MRTLRAALVAGTRLALAASPLVVRQADHPVDTMPVYAAPADGPRHPDRDNGNHNGNRNDNFNLNGNHNGNRNDNT